MIQHDHIVAPEDYLDQFDWPYLRIRVHIETRSGDVTSFLVKLEYNREPRLLLPDDWCGIARFDHNPVSATGHDVQAEGLHLDVLDAGGNKIDVRQGFPDIDINKAPAYCQEWFRREGQGLAAAFENREQIDGKYGS